jgi:transcription elongation factor Elf1
MRCNCCGEVHYEDVYTDLDGVTWYYRVVDYSLIQRSQDKVTWREISEEEEAEMTAAQLEFLSSLKVPF